ncbi:hypothetical protein [Streptomyces sp. NPDC055036]
MAANVTDRLIGRARPRAGDGRAVPPFTTDHEVVRSWLLHPWVQEEWPCLAVELDDSTCCGQSPQTFSVVFMSITRDQQLVQVHTL